MKLKGRSLLVLALILFGGFAVYDYFQDKKKEGKTMEESRLLTVNFEQVDSFEIKKGEHKILLKRSVDGWELVEPLQDLADNTVADDFVKGAVPERIIEVAKEGSDINWSLYGLDKPLGMVTFKTSTGAQNVFEISERRNFEENVFARRDQENRVLVLNSVWQNRVNKTALDFRDRRFLRHKIASVDVLNLKNEKGLLALQRVDGKWQLSNKKDITLDQNKVRDLLTVIADAKAAEIFADKTLPVQKKLFTLDLALGDKKWSADVGQAKDLLIYAKVSEPPFQFKMEPGALDKLIKMTSEDLKEEPPKKVEEATAPQQKEQK